MPMTAVCQAIDLKTVDSSVVHSIAQWGSDNSRARSLHERLPAIQLKPPVEIYSGP